ncbi:10108_t:CDS:1, partial [Entrophospora sp. SA101]
RKSAYSGSAYRGLTVFGGEKSISYNLISDQDFIMLQPIDEPNIP